MNGPQNIANVQKEFSIVQATIHIELWSTERVTVNGIIITPEILYEYGLLRKILFTGGKQASQAFLGQRVNTLIQDIFAGELVHKGFVCLEINAQPPDFSSHYPCFTKQEVKIRILHYQVPRLDIFNSETFQPYIIPEETRRKLRLCRSYVLSKSLTDNVYFLGEDSETKIYGELGL